MASETHFLDTVDQQVQRYKHVISVMPAGVILLNSHGHVIEANPEAMHLLGMPLINLPWLDVIARSFAPKEDDGHEVSLRDGKRVKLAISPVDCGQLILITDLTETRLLQTRISDLQRLSSLGKMMASLAHQVRTPLASAMLYAANLQTEILPLSQRERFQQKLMARLHDLEKHVDDMLLFAKGGDNKVVNVFTLKQLLDEFDPMIETVINSQTVHFERHCDLIEAQLLGNVSALARALSNLVVNAVQMAGKGCHVIFDCRQHQDHLLISIADDGPGISEELQQKIMEPFFTTRPQGSGLGLAVVNMVCHAHKGRLSLQSKEGEGACFTLCLPLVSSHGNDAEMMREGQ